MLIRSLDRAYLEQALDSVALQTYPHIEVVVIAARPGHRFLPATCGSFPLRLVPTESHLSRSKAANRALDEARGQWLLFLDDDDWLMPDHVRRLAEVLRKQPLAMAAYTGVSFANAKGEPLGQTLDLPFDGVRQLSGNLTPIHSVLFSRELPARGARFDEGLDHYEDWDFWLQVSRHTIFVHLPGVSAVYRLHQSSGVHDDPGPQGASSQRIYHKWQALWGTGEQAALMQRVWAAHDLELALRNANQTVAQQQRTLEQQQATLAQQQAMLAQQQAMLAQQQAMLAQQQATIHEQAATTERLRNQGESCLAAMAARDSQIAGLMNSASWKVTAPLRWLSRTLGRRPR